MSKTYKIITFGCQMNHSDSERVASICESMGYTQANDGVLANLYIINTCSVRQKAEDRVLGLAKYFNELKSRNPQITTVLTGCMAKRDLRQTRENSSKYREKHVSNLKRQMPWIDLIVEINEIHNLPKLLGEKVETTIDEYLSIKPKYNSNFQAFVPISTGCNKFCTFCIVPFTRGEELYRPYQEIYSEVRDLVSRGYKEITLLGQNVNSWRSDTSGHLIVPVPKYRKSEFVNPDYLDFADLLESLADIEGDFWLRFTSSHPYDINLKLADLIADKKNIAKQVHFAMQSGSNSVLRRMNRHYTIEEFCQKVELLRKKIPQVSITTDVIVGFCGETESEFEETLKVCELLEFDQIYIAEYSQRAGTIAAKFYKDDVPKQIKTKRKAILNEVLKKGVLKRNKELVGTIQRILVQKVIPTKNKIIGKTTQGKEVIVENLMNLDKCKVGEFAHVKITDAKEFVLYGEIS